MQVLVVNRGLKVVDRGLMTTGYGHNLRMSSPQSTVISFNILREK